MARLKQKFESGSRSPKLDKGGWQIVYTGFILIMLSFFIMLTSFATLEKSKITQFVQSFSNAISVFSGGKNLEPAETMLDTYANIMDKEDKLAKLFQQVKMLSDQSDLDQVQIRQSKRGVVMTLADNLLFDSGEARIAEEAYPLLTKIVTIIQEIPVPVEIEGHTDNVPIQTAAFPSNWELSTARAVNVLRFFINKQNIDTQRLSAVGFAEFQPAYPNETPAQRAKNRRVEIVFLAQFAKG